MTQQCGKCKYWDRKNKTMLLVNAEAPCLAPVPYAVKEHEKSKVQETEGMYCSVYEEREKCEE